MARQPEPQILKQQALLEIEQSRAVLAGRWAEAREQWSPRHFIHDRIEKHRFALLGITAAAAALAGFILMRRLLPGRENSRDSFSKPAKKRTLASLLLAGLWGMGREPIKALAVQQLLPLVANYLSRFHSPLKPPPSE